VNQKHGREDLVSPQLRVPGFFYQYFRCYSPVAFGKKTDPEGNYIRRFVPALRRMPKKSIHRRANRATHDRYSSL
jgi:deoxyribodipyrimidine photolyase